VVFISHKLNEVFEITDRIVVLRDGANAGELETRDRLYRDYLKLGGFVEAKLTRAAGGPA